ncbi:MAG TPA: rubrerythrin [Phycisphaerales bacterium]|nr:rubrerythrin [Phycisphaerales bacterium]
MITFSAGEIFKMAQDIEADGARFYRKAAEHAAGQDCRGVLRRLADMEEEHEQAFIAMSSELTARDKEMEGYDPDGEAAMYLRAMVEGKVFSPAAGAAAKLTGKETADEILRTAVELEKDSILFYLGMKDMVTSRSGKKTLEKIIGEEMDHISTLCKEMESRG